MTKSQAGFERLLTTKEAAEILNVSQKTLQRRIAASHLPIIRDGNVIRIRPEDLRAYIALRRCE